MKIPLIVRCNCQQTASRSAIHHSPCCRHVGQPVTSLIESAGRSPGTRALPPSSTLFFHSHPHSRDQFSDLHHHPSLCLIINFDTSYPSLATRPQHKPTPPKSPSTSCDEAENPSMDPTLDPAGSGRRSWISLGLGCLCRYLCCRYLYCRYLCCRYLYCRYHCCCYLCSLSASLGSSLLILREGGPRISDKVCSRVTVM